jgi:hypothetical protein
MSPATLIVAVVIAAAVAGCSGGGDADRTVTRSELEGIIRSQLPDKVRERGGPVIYVQTVQCTSAGGNRYDCIATVVGSDGRGHPATEDIGITGTCDSDTCVWRTEPSF